MNIETATKMCQQLRLFNISQTLEQRISQAQQDALGYTEFLTIILQDELQIKQAKQVAQRIRQAQFEEEKTFDGLDLKIYPGKIQILLKELKNLSFLLTKKNIIIMGQTGTGKTHIAQSLGFEGCKHNKAIRFISANNFYRVLNNARADNTWEKKFRYFLKQEILIIDDFGLKHLEPQQSYDIYELIAERYNKGGLIFTSNRTIDAWVPLFPDKVMANAALDRLANTSYQIFLENIESFRTNMRPCV